MSEFEFTDDMAEVSGFGDEMPDYEEACRRMVTAAAEWLDENPDADITIETLKGVVGMDKAASEDAEALEEVMVEACKEDDPGSAPTGAMMSACLRSALYIHEHGWDGYVEHMEGRGE